MPASRQGNRPEQRWSAGLLSTEGPRGEEGVAQVLDLALDLALLVAAPRGAGAGGEVVVPGEFEQPGMELDGVAAAVEDGASEVVVDEGPGGAAQGSRSTAPRTVY